jgi:hypothetical protein
MNNRNPENVLFETIASGTMVLAALAITTLLYQQLIRSRSAAASVVHRNTITDGTDVRPASAPGGRRRRRA